MNDKSESKMRNKKIEENSEVKKKKEWSTNDSRDPPHLEKKRRGVPGFYWPRRQERLVGGVKWLKYTAWFVFRLHQLLCRPVLQERTIFDGIAAESIGE